MQDGDLDAVVEAWPAAFYGLVWSQFFICLLYVESSFPLCLLSSLLMLSMLLEFVFSILPFPFWDNFVFMVLHLVIKLFLEHNSITVMIILHLLTCYDDFKIVSFPFLFFWCTLLKLNFWVLNPACWYLASHIICIPDCYFSVCILNHNCILSPFYYISQTIISHKIWCTSFLKKNHKWGTISASQSNWYTAVGMKCLTKYRFVVFFVDMPFPEDKTIQL